MHTNILTYSKGEAVHNKLIKIRMSDNERRHQFGVCHFGVVSVFYAQAFKKVVTDAVDGGNTIDHSPLFVFV